MYINQGYNNLRAINRTKNNCDKVQKLTINKLFIDDIAQYEWKPKIWLG